VNIIIIEFHLMQNWKPQSIYMTLIILGTISMSCDLGPFTIHVFWSETSKVHILGQDFQPLYFQQPCICAACLKLQNANWSLFSSSQLILLHRENISSRLITALGKYFFSTYITALGKYFNVFRLPAAPPQQGSGSQPLAPYFNAIDSINWKPTKI